jgi:polysaccharide pyruvyl transferase WcaK-like protein
MSSAPPIPPAGRSAARRVLVLGWYGTETIGDMAILAGLVSEYRQSNPDVSFIVPSQYPAYTRHNVARLGLEVAVPTYGDPQLLGDLWNCDTVIIGGGPLMDIPQLNVIATLMERAHALGRRTVVEGCGVGPAHWPSTRQALQRIVKVADVVRLRDQGSARLLREIGITRPVEIGDDPAARWVRSTGITHRENSDGPICVFARQLTSEYPQSTTPESASASLATFVQRLCDWYPERQVRLHAMHHFPVGGDDRVYARRLAARVDRRACSVDHVPRTPIETVNIMADAAFVVCMRFHSLVFAHAIRAPLLAIDYTDGGKVFHYTREHGLDRRRVALGALPQIDRWSLVALGLADRMTAAV